MYLVKLGGSVITDKSSLGCFRENVADGLAESMRDLEDKIIVVHGAGSFGHILAEKYNLDKGFYSTEQIKGFAETQGLVQKLNTLILEVLHKHGLPAVSIAPHDILWFDNHELRDFPYQLFEKYLEKGFIPVTFGDVVLDVSKGCSICSGDTLILALAKYFQPKKVIFVIDEDGLYTSNPKIHRDAEFIEEITPDELLSLETSLDDHPDVTSGMKGKIKSIIGISKLSIDTILVNGNKPERLYDILHGRSTRCTIVKGCC
ncbi:MAG TPA: isopentenyl phosphate kinase family protein [Thermoplasmatales archaeon]|nr:isopentenyl phosphate kinase family protein [Thermoplasmatales archaeon]